MNMALAHQAPAARPLCAGMDYAVFFHPSKHDEAKAVCAACPISATCLDECLAVERGRGAAYRHGVYGGTTPEEREAIDRERNPTRHRLRTLTDVRSNR